MRGVHGIGEDALAGMESLGALGRQRLIGLAARAGFVFGGLHFHQREVGDGAGPSKLGVVEGGKVGWGGGEVRGRQDDKNDMPQRGGYQSAARDFALDPAFLEEAA